MNAVHNAPSDYPNGKKDDVLTVEFTVFGIPCLGLNGGPTFKQSEAFSFQIATDSQEETDPVFERDRRERRAGEPVRVVQGPLGSVVADHSTRADRGARGWRCRSQARLDAMMPMRQINVATIQAARRG